MPNVCCYIVGDNELQDDNENCLGWAYAGECAKNPEHMLVNCKKSCDGNVTRPLQERGDVSILGQPENIFFINVSKFSKK